MPLAPWLGGLLLGASMKILNARGEVAGPHLIVFCRYEDDEGAEHETDFGVANAYTKEQRVQPEHQALWRAVDGYFEEIWYQSTQERIP